MNCAILDTNVLSYIFNKHSLGTQYEAILIGRKLVVAFVSIGELHEGLNRANWSMAKREQLMLFLRRYRVLESNPSVCQTWGWLRSHRKHQSISENDAWIAATALAFDMPLATHNAADFQNIPCLKLLAI